MQQEANTFSPPKLPVTTESRQLLEKKLRDRLPHNCVLDPNLRFSDDAVSLSSSPDGRFICVHRFWEEEDDYRSVGYFVDGDGQKWEVPRNDRRKIGPQLVFYCEARQAFIFLYYYGEQPVAGFVQTVDKQLLRCLSTLLLATVEVAVLSSLYVDLRLLAA